MKGRAQRARVSAKGESEALVSTNESSESSETKVFSCVSLGVLKTTASLFADFVGSAVHGTLVGFHAEASVFAK